MQARLGGLLDSPSNVDMAPAEQCAEQGHLSRQAGSQASLESYLSRLAQAICTAIHM